MPSAMLKPCTGEVGCPELTTGGPCAKHARQRERFRGSAASRGYDYGWVKFKARFIQMLIARDIAPACGAALPGGPSMQDSRCKATGVLETSHLHLDHDPPLRDEERSDPRKVCDPMRVGLLCRVDHNRKTQREQQGAPT